MKQKVKKNIFCFIRWLACHNNSSACSVPTLRQTAPWTVTWRKFQTKFTPNVSDFRIISSKPQRYTIFSFLSSSICSLFSFARAFHATEPNHRLYCVRIAVKIDPSQPLRICEVCKKWLKSDTVTGDGHKSRWIGSKGASIDLVSSQQCLICHLSKHQVLSSRHGLNYRTRSKLVARRRGGRRRRNCRRNFLSDHRVPRWLFINFILA